MVIDSVLKNYAFNLVYAETLVEDLNQEMMTEPLGPGLVNHPAFTLGHLCVASAMVVQRLGGEQDLPEGWADLFGRRGPGDPRQPDSSSPYPSKGDLLGELKRQHDRVATRLAARNNEELMAPVQWRFAAHMSSLLDLVVFMCLTHESMHLSQVAAWRRAKGLPSALAAIQ